MDNMNQTLKAGAKKEMNRKPVSPQEIRERFKNMPFYKMLEKAKKMNELNK